MRQTLRIASAAALLVSACGFSSHCRGEKSSATLTSQDIDALVAQEPGKVASAIVSSDEQFLRRASLDLIGRPPTPAELAAFLRDAAADKRAKVIDRLLDSKEFGQNWANY